MKLLYKYLILAGLVLLVLQIGAGGSVGSQSYFVADELVYEKSISTEVLFLGANNEQEANENTIFSKSTIIFLLFAVIGIASFRRNTSL